MNDVNKQSIDDFQLIHRSQNLMKREICKKCRASGERYSHPTKEFVIGTKAFDASIGCNGCYLATPEMYR